MWRATSSTVEAHPDWISRTKWNENKAGKDDNKDAYSGWRKECGSDVAEQGIGSVHMCG